MRSDWKVYAKWIEPVESRITCNPPPTNTDADFLVLTAREDFEDLIETAIVHEGFVLDSSDEYEGFDVEDENSFNSLKKGDINIIVTCSEEFFDKFMEATRIAKEKNLLSKEDRIALFQKVLYDTDV